MVFSQLTREQQQQYQHELRELYYRRAGIMLMLAVVFFLLFAVLDWILVPDLFTEFFLYRVVVGMVLLLLFFLNRKDKEHHFTVIFSSLAYLFSLLTIDLMIIRMGGVRSPYFAGLILSFVFYNAMLPASVTQSLASGFTAIFLYLGSIFFLQMPAVGQGMLLFNNIFFIAGFVMLVTVQSWYESRSRQETFMLRMQEEAAASELYAKAEALEQEVIRRTEEQRRTEKRFQFLFDHLIDDVMLVDPKGELILANRAFYRHLGIPPGERVNLMNLVNQGEQKRIRHDLLDPVGRGGIVRGLQTRFLTAEGEYFDVEINGSLLQLQEGGTALQLIIRDITVRKQMEHDLRRSLQMKKQTENATIMALARLSEYRDITPNNHLERIREYTRILADELSRRPKWGHELAGNAISDLSMASVLHDIGMVGVPDAVLCKERELSETEQEQVRRHTLLGGEVIKAMEMPEKTSGFLKYAKSIAYFHHERWDGGGYPFGLLGEEIPPPARIVAVVDAYEQMTSPSGAVHGEATGHRQALNRLLAESGKGFDPEVIDALLNREQEFDWIRQEFSCEATSLNDGQKQ